jgi:hypothetical protein
MDKKKIVEDGREIYLYENGLKRDARTGFIVAPAPGSLITPESAADMKRIRKEKARERAIEGLDQAVIEAGGLDMRRAGSGDGWMYVIQHVTKTLLESKNIRGLAEAGRFLGTATGATIEDKDEGVSVSIAQLFDKFLDRLPRQEVDNDIIDAE